MRIALYFDYADPVFFYRLQPWQYLARQGGFEIHNVNAKDQKAFEGIIASYDALIISRPHTEAHYNAIKLAKLSGVKVIADYDDDIFAIPKDNPVWEYTEKPRYSKTALSCLMFADERIASTEELLNTLLKYAPRSDNKGVVIPNAINDFALPLPAKPVLSNSAQTHYIWRGGSTHVPDLVQMKHRPGKWTFIGYNPAFLQWDYTYIPFHGIYEYYQRLRTIAAYPDSVMIYPLQDNQFNRCKSEGVVLEAAWAGLATIANKSMPQFRDISGVLDIDGEYSNEEIYQAAIETNAWALENRMLSYVNIQRAELLKQIAQ